MKKVLLFAMMLFCVSVNASTNGQISNIKIENVKMEIAEEIGYKDNIELVYSINPRDAKNLKLTWEVKAPKGVNVNLKTTETTESDGKVLFEVENTTEKEATITVYAKQNNKVVSTSKFTVENKAETVERVTNEVNELIKDLDDDINKNNYEVNKEAVEKIEKLLEDEEIKNLIGEENLDKLDEVSKLVDEYKEGNPKVITAVTVGLVVVFTGLLFWIFNKED